MKVRCRNVAARLAQNGAARACVEFRVVRNGEDLFFSAGQDSDEFDVAALL